jgi:hypothetical protein
MSLSALEQIHLRSTRKLNRGSTSLQIILAITSRHAYSARHDNTV